MGGKTSTTTQQVSIPKEVMDRYNAINARAEEVASRPFQIYSTDPSAFVAQLNQQQLTGIENVNAAAGSYQPYLASATDATKAGMASVMPGELEIGKYMNPYQKDVIDATMARMRQEQEQAQSGALGTAISSGAFGGDRAGIAAANLAQQQGMATGQTLAGLNAQNFAQALQTAQQQQGLGLGAEQANLARLLSGGQQLAGLGQAAQAMGLQGAEAQINAGTLGQQTEQAGLSALYNQFMQQQAYPFQVAQFLANIGMGTGALSGSTTTTTQPAPFFSDRRLKEDIKRIGKTDDGLPIYKFKYKGDPEEQTHIGFMADEVEEHAPEAVGLDPSGYKTVDYDRATKADGGGVAGPYGAMVGSQPGAGGYVPQAYLPVGELMVADSSGLAGAQRSFAEQLEAAANFGENLKSLDEDWKWAKEKWGNKKRAGLIGEAEEARGVAGYASGGPAYLEGGVKPADNPVQKEGYISDTVKSQEEGKKNQIMQPGGMPDRPESGLKQLGDAASAIASIFALSDRRAKHSIRRIGKTDNGMPIYSFKYKGDDREQTHIGFMADEVERKHPDAVMTGSDGMKRVDYAQAGKFYQGGLVRHGYATDGAVEDEIRRRRLLSGDVPAAQTLGSMPDAVVTPAREAMPTEDLTGLARAAINRSDINPAVTPSGVAAAKTPEPAGPMVDTGKAPEGGYAPIVPLKTQLDFVMHELEMPQYNRFLRTQYKTPEQAAIGFENIYERANGAGNDRAAAYARDVYSAAANGDMSGLPPNAIAAFEHFTANGMDPIKAAGATGRLMVESYAHMDPNARNTLGGGYGTYGVAQWRGPRIEALAEFAGVPLEAISSAPVSTPEGRYYSTGSATSGLSGARSASVGDEYTGGLGLKSDKPYEERTTLGKMFYNTDGTVNRDALMSLASGVGAMLSSPSQFFLPSLGLGLQGAASTYAGLEQQRGEITKQNISNMSELVKLYNDFAFSNPEYAGMSIDDFARSQGLERLLPRGGIDYDTSTGFDVTQGGNQRVSLSEARGYIDAGNGIKVPFMNDYASLNRVFNEYNAAPEGSRMRALADQAKAKMTEIEATGYTTGIGPDGSAVTIPVEAVRAKRGAVATDEANVETTQIFRDEAQKRLPQIGGDIDRVDRQIDIYTKLPPGAWTEEKARLGAIAATLGLEGIAGLPVGEQIALVQEAVKEKARSIVSSGGTSGMTDLERDFVNQASASPNLQPEAIRKLLAIEKATLLREQAMLEGHTAWMTTARNPYDLNAYKAEFSAANPISDYIKAVEAEMPKFAGEAVTVDNAPDGSTDTDQAGRPIIKRNGKWELQ